MQLFKGPNRILLTLEDLTFINPELSKRVGMVIPYLSIIRQLLALKSHYRYTMCVHHSNSDTSDNSMMIMMMKMTSLMMMTMMMKESAVY